MSVSDDDGGGSSPWFDPRAEEIDDALEAAWVELPRDDGLHHVMFPERDPVSKLWTGAIVDVSTGQDEPTVPIGDELALPQVLTIRRGTLTIVVDNTNGAPSYTVTVSRASTGLLRRLRLQPLVEQALGYATTTTKERPRGAGLGPGTRRILAERGPLPVGSLVRAPETARRYVRSKVSERDVERAAEAYNAGGVEELKRVMHVGDRQAWRYVSRGQDAGLIERKRAARRAKGTP